MKITVVGTGYVGLVAGACLADGGNDVICIDKDKSKIDMLKRGEVPIYEPGLREIVARNAKGGRIRFTTDMKEGVEKSQVIFIAVGTPESADGSADLSAIFSVADDIARFMDGHRVVVVKSTVPVGTHRKVSERIRAGTSHDFDYVSNPEFMKEGAAIEDFVRPDRVIIGVTNPDVEQVMREVYAPYMRTHGRMLVMDPASAEMSKYASNALLATKISFMNELSGLCEKLGADVERVRRGVGSDSRIGTAFLFPGVGYGGSCFPKDVSALIAMGEQCDNPMDIVQSVHDVNQRQRRRFGQRVIDYFGDQCQNVTLGVWGLAFKARTDDVRESPAIDCIRMFLDCGMTVRAYDPEALDTTRAVMGNAITYSPDGFDALDGADALVIFTDWQEFRNPDFDRMAACLSRKVVFDGRNLYEKDLLAKHGLEYHCVGRAADGA